MSGASRDSGRFSPSSCNPGAPGTCTDLRPGGLSAAALSVLFEGAPDAALVVDPAGRLVAANRHAREALGCSCEQLACRTLADFADHRFVDRATGLWDQPVPARPATIDGTFRRPDGTTFPAEASVAVLSLDGEPRLMLHLRDATERLIAERELRQAQKLESVGRLAAGIAHEINTPIQFVGDNAHFIKDSFEALAGLLASYASLRQSVETGEVAAELLEEVARNEQDADVEYLLEEIPRALHQTLDGVERVATIVRAMKEFAHPDQKDKTLADLNQGLLSTITVARNELKYVAEVETELGDIPPILCQPGDLNQVFLNLLVNAAHAIADRPDRGDEKGRIVVQTAQVDDAVVVAISDTGGGIPEHVRPHIFDPFYTTKEVGRGTGQGLSLARAVVVDQHRGDIQFETEVGRGTTFYVRLPINGGEEPDEEAA